MSRNVVLSLRLSAGLPNTSRVIAFVIAHVFVTSRNDRSMKNWSCFIGVPLHGSAVAENKNTTTFVQSI